MRALRRIATPAGLGLALAGCSFNVDEFQGPNDNGSGTPLVGNTDAQAPDDARAEASTDGANDTLSVTAVDAAADTCVCVKVNGAGKCREWSPPGCGN
ncbi:MAG: hypothetical protein ACXVEF_12545 [Polyangiales bacterium]